jgi:glycerol-3-phosphate dehydrogenase
MISVFGGKLTTYRAMAQRVVDLAARQLGRGHLRCRTEDISLGDGERERVIFNISKESAKMQSRLTAELPHLVAEVVYAARYEMAMTVEDVLERRTRIAVLTRERGRECRDLVETILRAERDRK